MTRIDDDLEISLNSNKDCLYLEDDDGVIKIPEQSINATIFAIRAYQRVMKIERIKRAEEEF